MAGQRPPDDDGTDYITVETFSLPTCVATAADESTIALATPQAVEIVTEAERTSVDVDGEVLDVAVDRYVYVLTDQGVQALTPSGVSLWSSAVDGGTHVGTVRDDEVVVVATSDGLLVGVDSETGTELFRTSGPHDDGPPIEVLASGREGVALAAWTFLTFVDGEGQTVYEVNLDGAIVDVGVRSGLVVLTLKSGDLVAIGPDGDHVWSSDTPVDRLAPVGGEELLATTPAGVQTIGETGQTRTVDVADGAEVVSTVDQRLVCTVTPTEVSVARPAEEIDDTVSLTLLSDRLAATEPVEVEAENTTGEDQSASVGLRCDGVTVERGQKTVTLSPGEVTTVEFDVRQVSEQSDADVVVERDGTEVTTTRRPIERSADPAEVVEVIGTLTEIDTGTATVEVTARNEGERPVEDVGLRDADGSTATLEPGESSQFEVVRDVQSDPLEVAVVAGDTDLGTVSVQSPPEPSVTVERVDGDTPCIDVTVTNEAAVEWTESIIVVVNSGDHRLERSVPLPPESRWLLTIPLSDPPTSAFEVGVLFPELGHKQLVDLEGWDRLDHGTETSDGSTPVEGRDTRADQSDTALGASTRERSSGTGSPATRPQSGGDGSSDRVPGDSESDSPIGVSRTLESSAAVDDIVTERITISNRAQTPLTDVTVEVGDAATAVDHIEPNESASVTRDLAFAASGEHTIDGGRVVAGDHTESIEPLRTTVREAPVTVTAGMELGDSTTRVVFDVRNAGRSAVQLQSIGVDIGSSGGEGVWEDFGDGGVVSPGETTTISRELPTDSLSLPDGGDAVEALVSYEADDRERAVARTLAAISESVSETMAVDVVGETAVRDQLSIIELTVTNTGETAVSSVELDAGGKILHESYYSSETVPTLGSGETHQHDVAIRPGRGATASFELSVTTGPDTVAEYAVSGPVAETRSDWSDEMLAEWTATSTTDDEDEGMPLPEEWSRTPFSR